MARPVLGETIVASERARIGGNITSGSIRVTDPNCEQIRFLIKFADIDILDPRLFSEWQAHERRDGQALYVVLGDRRGSAIGAVDNETTPSQLIIQNPFISQSPPRRRFYLSDIRLVYSLAGRPGGVDVDITAQQLGADDGVPED